MKNHIVFKFLAMILCAAFLLGAVGSGAGIILMTEMDLYNRTVDEAYAEQLESYALSYAMHVSEIYASQDLGNAGNSLVHSYYDDPWLGGVFYSNRIGYTIQDMEGNVLQTSPLPDGSAAAHRFSFPVTGRYLNVLSETSREDYYSTEASVPVEGVTTRIGDIYVYDAIPETGADVYFIDVQFADGTAEGIGSPDEPLGTLIKHEDGTVEMLPTSDLGSMELSAYPICITFSTYDRTCIYEACSPEGVLETARYSSGSGQSFVLRKLTEEIMTYDAIPAEGCAVSRISVTYADGSSESAGGTPEVGFVDYDENGNVRFTAHQEQLLNDHGMQVTHIVLYDDESLLFESRNPEGIGYFYNRNGRQIFYSNEATVPPDTVPRVTVPMETTETFEEAPQESFYAEARNNLGIYADPSRDAPLLDILNQGAIVEVISVTADAEGEWGQIGNGWIQLSGTVAVAVPVPEETLLPTEETLLPTEETVPELTEYEETIPEPTEVTVPMTEPVIDVEAMDYEIYEYYDHSAGQRMVVEYTQETIPGYQVEISLTKDPLINEAQWVLVRSLSVIQRQLPIILGISLLLLAILVIYLCCAAARKPGTVEIQAGGLNRVPLDLYAFLTLGGALGMLILAGYFTPYFLRRDTMVGILFAGLDAYVASLLVVAFFFACAAQFKTPGGYWWRNSLCGRCIRLIGKCFRLLAKIAEWMYGRLWPGFVKLIKGIFKLLAAIVKQLWKWVLLILGLLKTATHRFGKALNRFFSMLPLTWQWLLAGFLLIVALLIGVDGFKDGNDAILPVVLVVAFGMILYGAHCFGSLLESAKRMSKGDLDEKVDDKLMTGSFKEFAGELNGLADVAVVAAQKQLKSERMKTELITNVSHDIKTPLTSIINYVDLLQKPHTEEDQDKYLEVLDRQSQRLKKLIDDLMEMSKASTGNLSVDITRVDAGEAVNQALGEFADKLDKTSLFPVFRQPEKPVYMMADGRLVWRVMSNLLSNAVKYALPGTRLYVDLQKLDSKVIISLKNISREELNVNADELLERFVRGDASRNTEGSGLGLNIAQSLMELQKGQLQILVDGDLFKVTLIFPGVE